MKITVPWGYDEIAPLQRTDKVLLRGGGTPVFCRATNALALSFAEFVVAARDYPIVFAATGGGDRGSVGYVPVIVLGLADRSNLFVNAAGDWDPACYLPAYVRRYPFCISKVYDAEGKPGSERVVYIAKTYLDPGGVALFDAAGKPGAQWQGIERLLSEYEADLDRTAEICAALQRLDLFVPFSMEVVENGRKATRLKDMFRVDEAKLAALKPAAHKALVTKGFMGRVYAHLHSLENFSRLYRREEQQRRERQRGSAKG
ncbi:MAG: SapC family protein [Betaproteobacteria bacterium]